MKTRICLGVKLTKTMNDMAIGEVGLVAGMTYTGALRRRLQDIGICEGTEVRCVQRSPLGDPTAFFIRGAVIAIRKEDLRGILIE